jgi:hypothetical protein
VEEPQGGVAVRVVRLMRPQQLPRELLMASRATLSSRSPIRHHFFERNDRPAGLNPALHWSVKTAIICGGPDSIGRCWNHR